MARTGCCADLITINIDKCSSATLERLEIVLARLVLNICTSLIPPFVMLKFIVLFCIRNF